MHDVLIVHTSISWLTLQLDFDKQVFGRPADQRELCAGLQLSANRRVTQIRPG
jgi:hypothetical protein